MAFGDALVAGEIAVRGYVSEASRHKRATQRRALRRAMFEDQPAARQQVVRGSINKSGQRRETIAAGRQRAPRLVAQAVARRNGARLVADRIEWLAGDWYAPLGARRFEAIVSNPPYIAADDPALGGDGLAHEPHEALTPGGDGMSALATLINGAPGHLVPGGWLFLEHGATQGAALRDALVARGFTHVTSHRDLAGHERVTEGCWPR